MTSQPRAQSEAQAGAQSRSSPGSTPPAPSPPWAEAKQLVAAVHALSSSADRGRGVELESVAPERVARYLRAVVTMLSHGSSSAVESGPYGEAITAVSAACADLDASDLPGAYLALRPADTALHEAATA